MQQTLNAMTFPLHGVRLIEASAGTGKTFTISGLYLRLLLGHGDKESRHTAPLTVEQILVVTFTEAATAELRSRIRMKIHDARIAFLRNQSDDPVIKQLLQEVVDVSWAIDVLLHAERQMDEAAIYTIHGFCQRMLSQNAFESGCRFNNEFVTNESKLKAQVVADYWRQNFYFLSLPLADAVRSIWNSPRQLLDDISGYMTGQPVTLTVEAMQGSLEELHQSNIETIKAFKTQWLTYKDEIASVINHSDVSKRTFTKKTLPAWIAEITQWGESPTTGYQFPDKLEKFSYEFLVEKTPASKQIPEHSIFHQISRFIANKPMIKEPLFAHAMQLCREKLRELKQEKHCLSFDDLLTHLSAAIDSDEQGVLVERIRQLYPVAMIDEFQDTDPLQYNIFRQIYLGSPETGLFMIGDPKQAIYSFRGADIFTYIRARNEVKEHYTLGVNWRSSVDMVNAVNGLFEQADSPFMYDDAIPFYSVQPSAKVGRQMWWLDGNRQKALTFWLQEAQEPLSKSDYLARIAEGTAVKICQILKSADINQTYFVTAQGNKEAIQAGNIAVLVRTGSEGQLIRESLAKMGVASVYVSNRDSVFNSPIAIAIQRLLRAVLYPEDEGLLRAALASDILMKSSKELDELNTDEMKLEVRINTFREYRKVWQQRGVMPMLRAVMEVEHIAENLLAQPFGERLITDFLHLSELLQQTSLTLDSEYALLRWFAESIQEGQSQSTETADEQIQRLESERNLVQIVTIHKSKGLEYDLVFLPFASAYREAKHGQYYDEDLQKTVLDITQHPASIALSDKERLAEDLRLLYVALTRAVYGCFVGIAPLRKGRSRKDPTGAHLSAIGYLIQNGAEGATPELESAINKLITQYPYEMHLSPIPELADLKGDATLQKQMELFHHHMLTARKFVSDIDKNWCITSYSGLIKQNQMKHNQMSEKPVSHTHNKHDHSVMLEVESESMGLDIESVEDKNELMLDASEVSIFTFPRGTRAGTFLHTIFEKIDFTLPATSTETTNIVSHLLQSEQYDELWLPVLQSLIDTALSTTLDGEELRLASLGDTHKLVEMEFLLPIKQLSAVLFNDLAKQYDPLTYMAEDLGFIDVQGMLKGFIDLVFVHKGKYYVLDWKSNHLGNHVSDYDEEALQEAMVSHRYDFQYQIYALALHRFLRNRLVDYNYEQHFGGVYYLFLRGIDSDGNGIFYNKPCSDFLEGFDRLIDGQFFDEPLTDDVAEVSDV